MSTSSQPGRRAPLKDRFEDKVMPIPWSGCWIWLAGLNAQGYGQIKAGRQGSTTYRAHRVSYQMAKGPIPLGMCVLHRCDVKACVNPEHLFLGTYADNIRDKVLKNRQAKGVTHGMAKLSVEQVKRIRSDHRTLREIGLEFGISQSQASAIKSRKNWRI